MTTGGEVLGSMEQRSDVAQDYMCSTCSKNNQATEASHYCPECDECYCKACRCDHAAIGRSKIEQWGKAAGTTGQLREQPEEEDKLKCVRHPHYDVELYCVDHDVVCCLLCPSTDHRSCLNKEKVVVAAEEHNLNDDIQNITQNIDNLKRKADYLSEDSEIKKQYTESSHNNYVIQLLEMKNSISAKFDQIKEESDRRKQHYITKFNMDSVQCTYIKDTVPSLKSALEPITDRLNHFIKVKRTKEIVDESNEKMSGIIGTEIRGVFEALPLDGEHKVLDVLAAEANFKMTGLRFKVRIIEDKAECEIVRICQIGNGNVVLADRANKRLKQLNSSYMVINHYELQGTPNDVCAVDESKVALAMQNKTVLIINVGTEFQIVRSLEMQHGCLQVAYRDGNIYIADSINSTSNCPCRMKVFICDKNGQAIANFGTGNNTHLSYSKQKSVAISQDGQKIYAAQSGAYVIAFDSIGNMIVESTQLNDVVGLCTDKSGNLFACISGSKEVLILSPAENFKQIKTVLSLAQLSTTPRAICFDNKLEKVVVGTERGDYIYLE